LFWRNSGCCALNSVSWSRIFCKTNLFNVIPFHSELRNCLFRKPRNEHFLTRNNPNRSDYIPRNSCGTRFRCQPYEEAIQAQSLPVEVILQAYPHLCHAPGPLDDSSCSDGNRHAAPVHQLHQGLIWCSCKYTSLNRQYTVFVPAPLMGPC
jgi:hypothetical protein